MALRDSHHIVKLQEDSREQGVARHLPPPSFWFQGLPSPSEAVVPAPRLRKSREGGRGRREDVAGREDMAGGSLGAEGGRGATPSLFPASSTTEGHAHHRDTLGTAYGPWETRTLHPKLGFDLGPTPRCKAPRQAAPQISKRRPRVATPVLDCFFFKHASCLLRTFSEVAGEGRSATSASRPLTQRLCFQGLP